MFFHKFFCSRVFIVFVILIGIINQSSAQLPPLKKGKDNFTSFTAEKSYPDNAKLNALTPSKYQNNPDFGIRLNDSAHWYEQIDKRTLKTRTYKGAGNEIIIEQGYDNLNYVDANGWLRFVNTKLKPSANGWSAGQQEIPVYLHKDASTALSLGYNQVMTFNKNVQFNQSTLSNIDHTVGDNGMYIKNVMPNTDRIIRFGRGRIETDYLLKKPLALNGDLIISEDIAIPDGYTISKNINYNPGTDNPGGLIVKDADGKTVAEIKAPFCYDNGGKSTTGTYQLKKQNDGYRLEAEVPSAWINDPLRQYPVTIDPVVDGTLSVYSGGIIGSCVYPNFDTASIGVTIPAGITVTDLFAQGEFYSPIVHIRYGYFYFQTSCLSSPIVYAIDTLNPESDSIGWGFAPLATNDLNSFATATCCFSPSCDTQILRLTLGISRDSGGVNTGCNANYIYYDPSNTDGEPFEAYIVGRSVESSYSVPSPLCSNQCTFTLVDTIRYGVPPYTITHPWMKDSVVAGNYSKFTCTSYGVANLMLTIPACRGAACTDSTLTIPPPVVVDACNDTVKLLQPQTVTLRAVPIITATPDSQTLCSGTNVNIALNSCLPNTTYSWASSEGQSGTGSPITNSPSNSGTNSIKVTYTVTGSANGCSGNPTLFPVTVTPFTVIVNPVNTAICQGGSTILSASGEATSYTWSPVTGLSCATCSNLIASPAATTTYVVLGTSGGNCSAIDSVVVVVNPNPTLTVSHDTTIFSGQSSQLFAHSNDSVTWSPSTGLNTTTGDSVIATPAGTTIYKVTAIEVPCLVSEDIKVTVIEPCEVVHVPSAFTPDMPPNNYLHVLNDGKVSLQEFRVYNRWGEMVFQTNELSGKWDGTYDGKPEPIGTYVYYALVNCQGKTITVRGDVTLLR